MVDDQPPTYDSPLLQAHAERWRKLRHLQGELRPLTDFLPLADVDDFADEPEGEAEDLEARSLGPRCGRVFRCSCGRCVPIWSRDRRRVWSQALAGAKVPLGMLTVTAPGVDGGLWWACEPGEHPGKCSGPRGCVVDPRAAYDWNSTSAGRRKRMYRTLAARLRRRGLTHVLYGFVWEPQKRGVGHLHLVVALHALPIVLAILRELGPLYGFGFIDDARGHPKGGGSERIAGYVAGYLNGDGKVEQVVAAVEKGIIPYRSWFIPPWLTRRVGVTMRSLRRVRRWWAASMGLLPPAADTGCGWLIFGGPAPKVGGRRTSPWAAAEAARLWRALSYSIAPAPPHPA